MFATSSDAPCYYSSFLLLVEGQEPLLLVEGQEPLVASLLLVARPGAPSRFLLLLVRPGAPSSVLAAGSKARSP